MHTMRDVLSLTEVLTKEGMFNINTGSARVTALKKFIAAIPGLENKEIHDIDYGNLERQYANIHPGEKWLAQYITRIKNAIADFEEYKKNPKSFKPKSRSRSLTTALTLKTNSPKKIKPIDESSSPIPNDYSASLPFDIPKGDVQYHPPARLKLRSDVETVISGLPLDLTVSESKQLQALLAVYVKTTFEE